MVKDEIMELINKRRANIAIIGLGYVGLPLAITFANAGFNVTGIDPIQEKVDSINRGESYILDVPNAQVRKHVEAGRLRATTDYSLLTEIDAVSICVPTPLRKTGDPDLSFIASASESLAPYLHRGMVIVLESSTYPGTTRELV
ncbi:MAG TPA: NAD(P)-binding domain-containing protein, partial [Anaerolineaceae bacterium]|nr:NAD(P)-binding domain-containing protein [Anaerolineaceae bacterium]